MYIIHNIYIHLDITHRYIYIHKTRQLLFQERGETIAVYTLCGFANLGSIGIMLGGLGAMAPEKKKNMAAIVLRAMIAGNVACFMTACIAGKLSNVILYPHIILMVANLVNCVKLPSTPIGI